MGSLCSNASRSIPKVIVKNNLPKISQPQVPKLLPKVSKQDTNSTSLSVPSKKEPSPSYNQPRSGVMSEIAKDAAGVALGSVVGTRISNMLDSKKDVEETVNSSKESDDSIDHLKNEELIEKDDENKQDDNDEQDQENYDDSEHE